jgi:cytochrome P450
MTELADRDYFTDYEILLDPYNYFEAVRARGPVCKLQSRDLVMVTGFAEAVQVHLNTRDFVSVITGGGPLLPLPFEAKGDDISAQVEANRDKFFAADLMVSYDGEAHAAARSLINPLFTPSRLRANEEYMSKVADQMVRDVVSRGGCEMISEIATPFVTMVIADLLGVPEEDREQFREVIDAAPPPGNIDAADEPQTSEVLQFMAGYFASYVQDRRANPRSDVLTLLSTTKYPDGTLPDVMEVVKTAMFLFAAGQDTSAKLLGNSMRYLAENDDMQQRLRTDLRAVPSFLEEMLRLEGSTKVTYRLAQRTTRVGDVEIPAGSRVVVALPAANRDPRRWEDPFEFQLDRPKIKEHLAFGRGAHTCAGAPLARVEVRVILEKFLEHTSGISLSEEHHGPPGNRNIAYEASYIIRGLARLHVDLQPR